MQEKTARYYDPLYISEEKKLGVFAGATSRMRICLEQALPRSNSHYLDEVYVRLKKIAKLCYEGYQEKEPNFIDTFFMVKAPVTKYERLQEMQKDVVYFTYASALLHALTRNDVFSQKKALLENEAEAAGLDFLDNEKEITSLCEEEERIFDEEASISKCLNQLSLCHVILGGECNRTYSALSILKAYPNYVTQMDASLRLIIKTQGHINGTEMWKQRRQIYSIFERVKPDPACEKINIYRLTLS